MNENQSRIAFLVGAGLVKDAGLPLSVELVSKLKTSLSEVSGNPEVPEADRTLAKLQLSALHFINGAIRFQEGVLNRDPDNAINIEQIAVAAIELQARLQNPLAPYTSGWHGRIVELEEQRPDILKSFIDFIYTRLKTWLTFKEVDDVAYLRMFRDFCISGRGVDIFSLNYDLCIETALREIADANFVNGFTPEGWRPDVFNQNCPIRLFKLHGSLDWVDDEAYGVCSFDYPRHKDAEDIEGQHRPLLIFGVSHKLTAKEPFLSLAYQFSQSVLHTTCLVVIGYSFGDAYINEIIEQGLRTNARLKIVIVAPNAEDLIRGHPLLEKNPRIKLLPKKAKEALSGGSLVTQVRGIVNEAMNEEPF